MTARDPAPRDTGLIDGDEVMRLVDRSPDGLLVLSTDGAVRYANLTAEQMLARDGEGLQGTSFGFPMAVEGEEQIELRRPDGSVDVVHMRVTPVTSDGEQRWVVALRRGPTAARPTTANGTAEMVRDDALAVTSHELRNPMTTLTGYVDVLAHEWDRLPDETRRRHVLRIQTISRRLQLVVARFLHSAQLESGLFSPQAQPTRLLDVLLEGAPELGDAAADVDIRVPETVHVDVHPDHVWSVLSNGILNALRHGRPPVVVSAEEDGAWVVLTVADHGTGVPEDQAERLFERFVRGSDTAPGTGLGLWITRSIARAYGGDAWYAVDGQPGARFRSRLPRATTEATTR